MFYFTSDEHYQHNNCIKYCNRPFSSVEEMNQTLIDNHNSIVTKEDITIHGGDFGFFNNSKDAFKIIKQLNGQHILLRGSHDKWMNSSHHEIWSKRIEKQLVVVCHYAMTTWECSHYNSWQLFGHSHGRLKGTSRQYDIGVDGNDFKPVSFDQIREIIEKQIEENE